MAGSIRPGGIRSACAGCPCPPGTCRPSNLVLSSLCAGASCRTHTMLRNIGSNWVLIAATMAATYILTPFVIRTLGQDGYGTWTLITAMTGYMSLLALGVPMASVRYLAQDIAEGDTEKMNKTIGTCVGLYLIIGAAALLVGAALTLLFALVFEVPASFHSEA